MTTPPISLSLSAQLHAPGAELTKAPDCGGELLHADGPTAPNLDYDMPFTPVVMGTEAVDTTPAEPGTLLPGTR
ncbi:hypothetical protein [Streptomyces sp. NBC_00878]|uniref:hypothetical protein n=1 Tax=Streptomyces sp. NBC_00878 TaxID=2975854 RepID=UPI002258ED88|nr:hypothetical protein [Streptomyces sp. NBC_00878]MCX4904211.1 hypothetical protein [Streptomyces sp. NBC_00878]